jgi:hypothetical protein
MDAGFKGGKSDVSLLAEEVIEVGFTDSVDPAELDAFQTFVFDELEHSQMMQL